ncbi:MAG: hypothetical protein AAF098_10840 [Pseudomonadota bacterium]
MSDAQAESNRRVSRLERVCGFIQRVTDSPHVKALLADLGLGDLSLRGGQFRPRGLLPGVIVQSDRRPSTVDAIWWFLLERGPGGWRPNPKYTSFVRVTSRRAPGNARCILIAPLC